MCLSRSPLAIISCGSVCRNIFAFGILGLQLHDASLGRILLALLYTLLTEGELRSAIELTELLIRQQDARCTAALCSQDAGTKASVLSLLQQVCAIKLSFFLFMLESFLH